MIKKLLLMFVCLLGLTFNQPAYADMTPEARAKYEEGKARRAAEAEALAPCKAEEEAAEAARKTLWKVYLIRVFTPNESEKLTGNYEYGYAYQIHYYAIQSKIYVHVGEIYCYGQPVESMGAQCAYLGVPNNKEVQEALFISWLNWLEHAPIVR
jgi:hypothetical protein